MGVRGSSTTFSGHHDRDHDMDALTTCSTQDEDSTHRLARDPDSPGGHSHSIRLLLRVCFVSSTRQYSLGQMEAILRFYRQYRLLLPYATRLVRRVTCQWIGTSTGFWENRPRCGSKLSWLLIPTSSTEGLYCAGRKRREVDCEGEDEREGIGFASGIDRDDISPTETD